LPPGSDARPRRPRRKRPLPRRTAPPPRDNDTIREAARQAAGASSNGGEWGPRGPDEKPEWWAGELEAEEPAARTGFDPQRTFGQWLESLIPPNAQAHFINAGREFATGVQLTVDHHLGRFRSEPETHGPIHIEID